VRYLVRKLLAATLLLMAVVFLAGPTEAQVSIGVGLPGISIGINVPVFPTFTVVPDYPVYYAPQANVNLFFYDGLYWVYQGDNWYASSWYDGPWDLYAPAFVPVFILRVPVRYYVSPPIYFRGWEPYGPPRWGEHWGRSWEQSRRGWDQWDRRTVVAPAPLPIYQRQYSGNRYPRVEQQAVIRAQNYSYRPQDPVARQHYQRLGERTQQPAGGARQQPQWDRGAGERQQQRQQPPAVEQQPQERQRQPQERQQQGAPARVERQQPQERPRPGPPPPQQSAPTALTPEPQRAREQRAQQPQPPREAPEAPHQQPQQPPREARQPPQAPQAPQAQRQRETQQGPPVAQHQQAAPQQQPQERQQRSAAPPQVEQSQQHGQEKGHGHEKE
jgi:hypothetical protein